MNPGGARQGGWVIALSFFLALSLSVVPLPDWASSARPEWVLLVLIYWTLALPERVGVTVGWLVGLLQDTLQGTLLGQHALAYAVVAWLILRLHQRLRLLPVWQQATSILIMLLLARFILLWANGIIGKPPADLGFWLSALLGAILWPWLFFILREVRRHFRVR
ncbi:rod shape-determining protein MreD [Alkalilimnicola sp. S0819]|uniref:rod shape-determining protein MreD n=1 Tax=Alkalilimnicola sp. S0819 TaxID=2613922 RepID=UPI0012626D77|nr:rod shape-determining protein MreD [Alkalilimnicola sp. S0819]KAB7623771.1 rod shape-determining protein MreD [Alkalilimnicola sp. S0819]MPQ16643.1 rod shape-determining protein MreD [Alkalilimnicola sp. S0819]